jgi:hypothetical protein
MKANMRKQKPKTPRTMEAVVDERGRVRLLRSVKLPRSCRAIVTLLEDAERIEVSDTALLSESALARDWDRPEEDEAWSHLQLER